MPEASCLLIEITLSTTGCKEMCLPWILEAGTLGTHGGDATATGLLGYRGHWDMPYDTNIQWTDYRLRLGLWPPRPAVYGHGGGDAIHVNIKLQPDLL